MHYALNWDPTIPVNSGLFEPVRMTIPQGTLLNPVSPVPSALGHTTGNRVCDVESGLLCQAVPDFMRSAGCGVLVPIVLAEPTDAMGKRKSMSWNRSPAAPERAAGSTASTPVNARSAACPIIRSNRSRPMPTSPSFATGSKSIPVDPANGAAAPDFELTFSPHRSGSQVLGRGVERFRFAPWGFLGGRCAERARIIKNLGRPDEADLGKIDVVNLEAHETITILTPGGGGFGDPLDRDPESVLADVARRRRDRARRVVRLRGGDRGGCSGAGRRTKRAARRATSVPSAALFDFGLERDIWDAVFDRDLVGRIHRHLDAVPATARSAARDELFAPVKDVLKRGEPFNRERLDKATMQLRQVLLAAVPAEDQSAHPDRAADDDVAGGHARPGPRISPSMRCRPHDTPSASTSCHTRLAHRSDQMQRSSPAPSRREHRRCAIARR